MKNRPLTSACIALSVLAATPAWAADRVELTTRVSGVVEQVLVKPGQRVAKGDVLLRLGKTILQARMDEAAAEYARAEAEDADAKRELERAQDMFERTVSSTSELDAATLRRARAQAALAAAKARRTIAQQNLADADLKAPFTGRIDGVPGGPGTVVTAECQPRTLVVLSARP